MYIPAINHKNNYQFGAAFVPEGITTTKTHRKIMKDIVRSLRHPDNNIAGCSMEQHYEKKGFDFIFYPLENGRVHLTATKRVKMTKDAGKEDFSVTGGHPVGVPIGTYDRTNSRWAPDDINRRFKERKKENILTSIPLGIIALGAACALFSAAFSHCSGPAVEKSKAIIENVADFSKNILK